MRQGKSAAAPALTNGEQGNPFVAFVAGNALGSGVQMGLAVHQEEVTMMPMLKLDGQVPGPVGHALHRVRNRIPIVKIPNQAYRLGLWRHTDKIHRLGHPLRDRSPQGAVGANIKIMTFGMHSYSAFRAPGLLPALKA